MSDGLRTYRMAVSAELDAGLHLIARMMPSLHMVQQVAEPFRAFEPEVTFYWCHNFAKPCPTFAPSP